MKKETIFFRKDILMKFFIINYGTKIYDKYHMFVFNMLKIKKIYNFMF